MARLVPVMGFRRREKGMRLVVVPSDTQLLPVAVSGEGDESTLPAPSTFTPGCTAEPDGEGWPGACPESMVGLDVLGTDAADAAEAAVGAQASGAGPACTASMMTSTRRELPLAADVDADVGTDNAMKGTSGAKAAKRMLAQHGRLRQLEPARTHVSRTGRGEDGGV
mgnify:CR=1 FL=1